ncbi:hypothetical protein DE146DRAFT_738351 [Phaeosphaeria sp. MPI-PUGE-AT-0046c]|nr:hypothetical protein DE146DRAFT_738351 [Phaeosphaeria sp. MPI-PUGE-AT-0046c]
MPRYNQIPKGTSIPADPEAPSLLTSVPPEVRNAIYSVLFARDKVLVHNTRAYHAQVPDRATFTDTRGYLAQMNAYNDTYEAEIGADSEFRDDLGLTVPLLQSCRQVYHESVGVLYGCNTFVVTRALNRHDCDKDSFHDTHAYSQLSFAPQWLLHLGSQGCLLRNVHIDVDAICPSYCPEEWDHFDILPLLKFLWHDAHKQLTLGFAHMGRRISVHKVNADPSAYVKADVYNNILHALVEVDVLCIKTFDYTIESLEVSARYEAGHICHTRVGRQFSHYDDIEIGNAGRLVRRNPKRDFSNIFESSSLEMLQYILQLVICSPSLNHIMFDINNHTVRNLPMNILQVSPQLRHEYVSPWAIGTTSYITFETSTNLTIADFDDLAAAWDEMQRRIWPDDGPCPAQPFLDITFRSSNHTQVILALNIKTSIDALLEDLHIDIKGLMGFCDHPSLGNKVSVQLTLWHAANHGSKSSLTVALSSLAKSIFLVLSDMLMEWPKDLKKSITKEIPSIWMNGRGTILEASYPGNISSAVYSVPNRHAELRPEEIDFRGCKYAATILKEEYNGFRVRSRCDARTLFKVWESLRDRYYPDWELTYPRG